MATLEDDHHDDQPSTFGDTLYIFRGVETTNQFQINSHFFVASFIDSLHVLHVLSVAILRYTANPEAENFDVEETMGLMYS